MGLQLEIRVLSVFLLLAFLYLNSSLSELKYKTNTSQSNENNWKNHTTSPTNPKPIIYTFFSPIGKEGDRAEDTSEHERLLHVWKTLWKESGWEPRLLTMDDARKHPDFKKYSDLLQNSEYPNLWDQSYNSLCFFRWLAMASHGSGGWMADYDTFPMGITVTTGLNLPNYGQFTSYKMHVPALLSGTAEEWERVSHLLLDQVAKEKKEPVDGGPQNGYSDMMALYHLHDDDPDSVIFKRPIHVLDTYPYKVNTEDDSNIIDCHMLFERNIWVAHLSHYATHHAIEENKLHITNQGNGANTRNTFAWELFFLWKYECLPVFDSEK